MGERTAVEIAALRNAAVAAMAPMTCGGHKTAGSLYRCEECLARSNAQAELRALLTPQVVLALLDEAAAQVSIPSGQTTAQGPSDG